MLQDILEKLYTIEHIPTHPVLQKTYKRLLALSGKKLLNNLEEIIIYDSALVMEFLKIANTDSFGFRKKISSIADALLVLDDELIKLVIKQHPVLPDLKEFKEQIYVELNRLIKHTIEVRIITNRLIKMVCQKKKSLKYSAQDLLAAASLHEIGLFFLIVYFPDKLVEITRALRLSSRVRKNVKQELFLPDHSLLGAVLCSFWNLPDSVISAITFHHYPWSGENVYKTETELLYLADNLSQTYYEIYYDEDDIYTMDEHIIMKKNLLAIIERMNLDMIDIARLRIESTEQSEEVFTRLGF